MRAVVCLSAAALMLLGAARAECPPIDDRGPRTLILALDGVPYRAVRTAQEMGAFAGWPVARPLVSPFPSMTNVGFAAILQPFGSGAVPGYEVRHYDPEQNQVGGGGVFSLKFDWRKQFQIQIGGFWGKAGLYLVPKRSSIKEMNHVEEFVLNSPDELMMALVSSTDSLTHFHGDRAIVDLLRRFSDQIEQLRHRHQEIYGRPLRLIMLSDHGNVQRKVHRPGRVKAVLKQAGLRPRKRLEGPDDVITVTYGVVGYGVLYLDPRRAEKAARAMLEHPGVHLSAWLTGPHELRMVSVEGEARNRWRDTPTTRLLAYDVAAGDPLGALDARGALERAGALDPDGFATREDWFEVTAFSRLPDAPARLVESLDGTWVSNAATVIFSFEPGYAWGIKSAAVGAWFKAGRLEATHGGLDRESTWGFFLTSDPESRVEPAIRADRALSRWAAMSYCTTASLLEFVGAHEAAGHRAVIGGR